MAEHSPLKREENSFFPKKKKRIWQVVLLVFVGLVVCFILVIGFVVLGMFNKVEYDTGEETLIEGTIEPEMDENAGDNMDSDEIDKLIERHYQQGEMISDPNVLNILLIGRDTASSTHYSRSDAMILMSINKRTKQLTMTSFLRDIYTQIPGKWNDKLNAAHAYGGPPLLMETLEKSFQVQIDHYISVNFESFPQVIDALGGVEIDVKKSEIRYVNQNISADDPSYFSEPGKHLLNGKQALSYSRIRKIDSDVVRAQRQRTVINEIIRKAKDANLTQLYEMVNVLLPYVKTDFTKIELIGQAAKGMSYLSYDMQELSVPFEGAGYGGTIRSQWVWIIDFEENTRKLQNSIYGFSTVDSDVVGY